MATIVVGIEDSPRGEDAVALAGAVARSTGADVLAVCAFPFEDEPSAHYNFTLREPLHEAAVATLERLCASLVDVAHVHRLAVPDPVPARALLHAADNAEAALIVVGSSHAGFSGHVLPGSTGSRLLQGAPCPVLLAPQGHRLRPHVSTGRVSVAFDGSATAWAALRAAAPLARAMGHSLRVVTVFGPDVVVPAALPIPAAYLRIPEAAQESARSGLDSAVKAVPGAEPAFLVGDPARELARESEVSELLVLGSRNYGPTPAVMLGDVSGAVVPTASCPVLVVPNGVEAPLETLLESCGELLTRPAA